MSWARKTPFLAALAEELPDLVTATGEGRGGARGGCRHDNCWIDRPRIRRSRRLLSLGETAPCRCGEGQRVRILRVELERMAGELIESRPVLLGKGLFALIEERRDLTLTAFAHPIADPSMVRGRAWRPPAISSLSGRGLG